MTTIFDGYDEEYRALTSDISNKLSEIATYEDQQGSCRLEFLTQVSCLDGGLTWCGGSAGGFSRQEEDQHRPCRRFDHAGAAAGSWGLLARLVTDWLVLVV